MSKGKCLVILSGGQDSTTCLAWAKQNYEEVHAVTFDYGQRHRIEIDSAIKVASILGVASHEIIKMPGILGGRSFLTDLNAEVEKFDSLGEMEHHNAFKDNKLDSSFVPMRNQMFITIATNRAYVLGCESMITGVTAADFAEYGEFSWSWLGGFIDAEGCINRVNGNGYRLSMSQKDPELMHRIGKWIKQEFPDFTYGLSTSRGCDEMTIGKRAYEMIHHKLTPHLHTEHRRGQAVKHGAPLADEAPMDDAYITGFWEGDGGCYSSYGTTGPKKQYITRSFEFIIYQKYPEILEKIQTYLQAGSLQPVKDDAWVLKISDGPQRATLLGRIKKHMCILHSFEKIDKNRHKIGMLGNGFNPPYPDCTPDFIYLLQKATNESLRVPEVEPIKIEAPLMYLSKAQSVKLAQTLPQCMHALRFSHTAYDGKYPPNGNDHASLLRAKGFHDADVPDPLVLRAWEEGLMGLPETSNYDQVRKNHTAIMEANANV